MLRRARQWIADHKIEFVLLIFIILIGGFLRIYHIGVWMYFGQDEARDALIAKNITADHKLLLLGPGAPNNSSDFHLGPFFYYLLAPFLWLGGYSPAGGAWITAIFSLLSIIVIYIIGRNFFSWRAGLIASSLFASSFIMVYYGRWMWNPNLVPIFTLLIFLSLYKLTQLSAQKKNYIYLYILAVCFGLVIQLHGTVLLLLPVILFLFFVIFRPRLNWKRYILALLIVVLLNIMPIIYDLTHDFSNTKGLVKIITQQQSGQTARWLTRFWNNFKLWENFWHDSLLHNRINILFYILLAGSIIFLSIKIVMSIKTKNRKADTILLCLWFFLPFFMFTFYKEKVPTHYFCLVFPLPFLLLAGALDFLWRKKLWRIPVVLLVLFLFGFNLYCSANLLRDLRPNGLRASSYSVTLAEIQEAIDYIVKDSQNKKFDFYSEPAGQYDLGYQYIFNLRGVILSVTPENIEYMAFENSNSVIPVDVDQSKIVETKVFGHVKVIKIIR